MEKKFGFTLLSLNEFETWIVQQNVARTVLYIQEHHTWSPNYTHFKGTNHFELQKSMQDFHTVVNGWQDIGQHFSIFPDGVIVTGRNLEISPACIYGNNSDSICIENVGNFDAGGDQMRPEQREAIIRVTAALCRRFRIPVNANRIVYHHWFDLNTGARTNGSGVTKTCPGTAFFGGNSVQNAEKNFLPLVEKVIGSSGQQPEAPKILYYAYVTAKMAPVRHKPFFLSRKINQTPFGSVLRIYEEKGNWVRISASKDEWVNTGKIRKIKRGTVNTDELNVRSGPGVEFAPPIGSIRKGHEVFVFAEKNNWVKIGVDERWVSGRFVDFV